jgi:maleylpyruvate isomerase
MSPLPRGLAQDRDAIDVETSRLLETVRRLAPDSLSAPTLCTGWTRGHVLSHIARNADGLVNLVTAVTTGQKIPMYASPQAREADIEAGSGRALEEQLADLEAGATRWREAAATLGEEHAEIRVESRGGSTVAGGYLPFMRLREVVIHHVDLRAGYDFADVGPDLVEAFLDDQVRRLRRDPASPGMTVRTDEGDAWSIGDGEPTVSGSRSAVLGWLTRGLTDGVAGDLPSLPFGG